MRTLVNVILVLLVLCSCKKDNETVLIIRENYAPANWPKAGLIKGNLYASFTDKPFYSNLKTNGNREIKITGLLEGTYKFEYYIKNELEVEDSYWPIPFDTVFQIKEGETKIISINK